MLGKCGFTSRNSSWFRTFAFMAFQLSVLLLSSVSGTGVQNSKNPLLEAVL
jgi:hypothetical protein